MELNAGKVLSVLNLVCQIWQVCCSVKLLVFSDIVSCTFIDSFFYIFFAFLQFIFQVLFFVAKFVFSSPILSAMKRLAVLHVPSGHRT